MIESEVKPARDSAEFAAQVQQMFDRVASGYDRMNSVMTVGMHHRWRGRAADQALLQPGDAALDLACGTGDLTFELARRVGADGKVVGVDYSEQMLKVAREKSRVQFFAAPTFERGDALELGYDDASFDAVTVGFAARNFADLDRSLSEQARVLRPGGRLVILEMTQPQRLPLSGFFSFWFDWLVPILGRFAGNRAAYSYLPESVRRFPPAREFAEIIDRAGFTQIRWTVLAGGIIAIYSAVKPRDGN